MISTVRTVVDEAAISMVLNTNFRGFEDEIQYSTAVINQLDAIVTRNPQDFTSVEKANFHAQTLSLRICALGPE